MNSLQNHHHLSGFLRNYHEQSPGINLFIQTSIIPADFIILGMLSPFILSICAGSLVCDMGDTASQKFIHPRARGCLARLGNQVAVAIYSSSRRPLAHPPMALRRAVEFIHPQPSSPTLWLFKSSRHFIYSSKPRFTSSSSGCAPCEGE